MTVFRSRPLPTGAAQGQIVVPHSVVDATLTTLKRFRGSDGRHEGLVYWAGRLVASRAYVIAAIVPECHHGPYRVVADERQIGEAARRARENGLGIVAQVHSHPCDDTRHSDGDDDLILMPFDGMFSIVVARYGDGSLRPGEGVGLHQYQRGRWVRIERVTDEGLKIVPTILEQSREPARRVLRESRPTDSLLRGTA